MALSDRAAVVGPYAQQLLANRDVQSTARQAADASRAVYRRARGQDAREAVTDRKLRRRVTAAVAAVGEFFGAVSESAPEPKSRWPRRVALLAALAAVGWMVSHEGIRTAVLERVGKTRTDDVTSPSLVDEPTPVEKEA